MIERVYIPNTIAMLLLLTLFISNGASRRKLFPDSCIFTLMMACNFHQCAGEILSYVVDGVMRPGFHELNIVTNFALYVINIVFSFLWVLYADYKVFEDVERIKKGKKLLALPAVVVIAGAIVNLFTPVFYHVTQDNVYQRTQLYLIPYLVTYFYLVYGTAFIYRYRDRAKKYLFLPAIIFMIPVFIGSLVQFFFYGYSTVWVGVAVGLVAVYVNVQNEMSYTDALSGLYTRSYMYQYLERYLRKGKKERLAGIMLDIDNFKMVNDMLGHLIGDDAIRSAGRILLSEVNRRGIGVRYGGDEFVILLNIREESDVKDFLDRLTQAEEYFNVMEGKKYSLHFSKGYSVFQSGTDTVDSFLERMDTAMYKAKKEHKRLQGKND